jgi:signal transduction histidine kinase
VITLALIVAVTTLAVGTAAVLLLRLLPTVRLQLVGLAFLAVVLPLVAVLTSGWVMFHMGADVKILAVASAAALAAVGCALFFGWSVASKLDGLAQTARSIGAGDLSARADTRGPDELAHVAQTVNDMAENLARLFDARRELVVWASHDLRTPVASMQAMLEAVEDGIAPADRYVPALRQQVRTLAMLVDDLFELARIDAGALTLEVKRADVGGLVASCLRGLEPEAEARQVRLEAVSPDGTAALCAPEKVERILYNLVTNALRHTPSDGAVAVRVEPRGEEVVVGVEDTGAGLDPQTEARMFERFWRADPARSGGRAGLGLAIARGLVEAQGGRIWAENRPGGGARICFTLPGG